MDCQEIVFEGEGIRLSGWICRPTSSESTPLIILTHGLSGLIDLGLDLYARRFVDAGFACLAYDHRNWGLSAGWPRCESDPWRQVADMREAISYARTLPNIDTDRIGLWGTSYSGGHVITVSALDQRVRCVVAQVPMVSGSRSFEAWVPADKRKKFLDRLAADWDSRARGEPPRAVPAALPNSETAEWVQAVDPNGIYVNSLTLRSFDLLRTYEPISFMSEVAPTPLMMIVANHDTQTPTSWALGAFEKAGEPKCLVRLNCRHYDPYMAQFSRAAEAAVGWFKTHLN